MAAESAILVLNAGSSSLKFQVVVPETADVLTKGLVERIGEDGSDVPDHGAAMGVVTDQLAEAGVDRTGLRAVGHRVVHGGPDFSDPVLVDDAVIADIRDLVPLAPLHNPGALAGIEAARAAFDVPQVAVFDTAFFTSLPAAASTYAIPKDVRERHRVRRYGFHGTSHRYVSRAAATFLGRPLDSFSQVVLHLGNGCSASAIAGGVAIDTSMGLTPLQGLVMGTRSGDIDPAVFSFLHSAAGLEVAEIDAMLNKRSGLKGLAGVNDFREVLSRADAGDEDAGLALDVYVHRLRHYVGAYTAVLGGLDVLTFTAGVGENAPVLRARVLQTLGRLGLSVDPGRNEAPSREARVISPDGSPVTVLVVPTNEELEIARQAAALLDGPT
ncbi:acetate kinase [Microlunatus antarcticus]|uniref:Acetate kinase n=1 Tax=Microlunatus antarcticus TaxID=53388 RepID=A0A7W5JZ21_9ACTN|nr:acetate kinase [Microlunatus antarcticus]MBB3328893.1 acetate kinase [Microlunatus antarcticus]MBB3328962.1 acetate kinase [Microlunatus antarcticus]